MVLSNVEPSGFSLEKDGFCTLSAGSTVIFAFSVNFVFAPALVESISLSLLVGTVAVPTMVKVIPVTFVWS